jgi:hypothetical protein
MISRLAETLAAAGLPRHLARLRIRDLKGLPGLPLRLLGSLLKSWASGRGSRMRERL